MERFLGRCKCEDNSEGVMDLVACWDSPNDGYAYNLFQCNYCGRICKNDVWKAAGNLWINIENVVQHENLEG